MALEDGQVRWSLEMVFDASHPQQMMRLPQVKELTALSRSSIYAEIKAGRFPKQVQLTAKCVAWNSLDVQKWIQDRVAQSRNLVKEAA